VPEGLVDIGVNLAHDSFDHDRDEVVARARSAGVATLVITGTSVAASVAAVALARTLGAEAFATAGIHPHHASEFDAGAASQLRDLAPDPRVVAVGECGLDYHRNYSTPQDQRRAFAGQLALAVATGLPVFLHERDAHADFAAMLREYRPQLAGGVAHCFTGGAAEIEAYLELGLYVGITGWIADERRAVALRDAVRRLPLDRVLVETDAPYLLPRTLTPKPSSRRNEPGFLPEVVRELARWMAQPVEAVAAASTRNARALFRLDAAAERASASA
jgi:TatD DNase family protein